MAKVRWQYAAVTDRNELAEMGAEGWELVSVVVVDGGERFYFKRPWPSVSEEITLSQRDQLMAAKGGSDE